MTTELFTPPESWAIPKGAALLRAVGHAAVVSWDDEYRPTSEEAAPAMSELKKIQQAEQAAVVDTTPCYS